MQIGPNLNDWCVVSITLVSGDALIRSGHGEVIVAHTTLLARSFAFECLITIVGASGSAVAPMHVLGTQIQQVITHLFLDTVPSTRNLGIALGTLATERTLNVPYRAGLIQFSAHRIAISIFTTWQPFFSSSKTFGNWKYISVLLKRYSAKKLNKISKYAEDRHFHNLGDMLIKLLR